MTITIELVCSNISNSMGFKIKKQNVPDLFALPGFVTK